MPAGCVGPTLTCQAEVSEQYRLTAGLPTLAVVATAFGCKASERMLTRVDLPAPLSPISPTTSPR